MSGSDTASLARPPPSLGVERWRRYSLLLMPVAAICFMVGIGNYRTIDLGIVWPSVAIAAAIWLGTTLLRRRLEHKNTGMARGFADVWLVNALLLGGGLAHLLNALGPQPVHRAETRVLDRRIFSSEEGEIYSLYVATPWSPRARVEVWVRADIYERSDGGAEVTLVWSPGFLGHPLVREVIP